ncbi:MAG: glycosyltransferase family 9 protein [Candidatus Omnitrophica bacterium]|nr:glycosyltransferase family 9 protein [Candidatus Omnitrophota bacterium]
MGRRKAPISTKIGIDSSLRWIYINLYLLDIYCLKNKGFTVMLTTKNKIYKLLAMYIDYLLRFLFFILTILFLYRKKKVTPFINIFSLCTSINPKRILIIDEVLVGDIALNTPVFRLIHEKYPTANITVMIGSWAKDILKNNPHINEIMVVDCPWALYDSVFFSKKGLTEHLKFIINSTKIIKNIRSKKYDLVIDLKSDFRNIFFFIFLTRIKYSLNYHPMGEECFLTVLPTIIKKERRIERNYGLLKYLRIDYYDKSIQLFPSEEDRRTVGHKLLENNIKQDDYICILHPGARRKVRWWPPERYAEVAEFLHQKGLKIILTGTKDETDIINKIKKNVNFNLIDMCGELSLLEVAILLKRAAMLICPDTGIMYLAAANQTPTIALFGPNDSWQPALVNKNLYIVDKLFPCRPCTQKICKISNNGIGACMLAITVKDVTSIVEKILTKTNDKHLNNNES